MTDPVFHRASPVPVIGSSFPIQHPISIDDLPTVDAVIISHDHYDHLDYETVKSIQEKTKHFFVPLGLGAHLQYWGVPETKITELDWWENVSYENLKLVCTPAQHFSGRKLNNSQSTLWSSWVITSSSENIYFSGDSGYASHFKSIGEKYGPFDIALLECGQYNEQWSDIHMMPEETAQAGLDVNAKKIMPIHWAGFKLALHDWKDPITRVTKKADALGIEVITPQIGEHININDSTNTFNKWWQSL
jgi:L-ascorbate metabolism protein UlaG (beta-lactamase superfamily)